MSNTYTNKGTIYNYDRLTGELLSEDSPDVSPKDGPDNYLLPGCATDIAPPTKLKENEVAVFENGAWQVKADWRKATLYSTTNGSGVQITEIGQTPADVGATELAPPSNNHSWQNGAWVLDPAKVAAALALAKKEGLAQIEQFTAKARTQVAGTQDVGEMAGWVNKLRIAQAIQAQTATPADVEVFKTEIDVRRVSGETLATFTQKVLNNANFYGRAVAVIDGLKRYWQDQINAATEEAALQNLLGTLPAALNNALNPQGATP